MIECTFKTYPNEMTDIITGRMTVDALIIDISGDGVCMKAYHMIVTQIYSNAVGLTFRVNKNTRARQVLILK